MSGGPGSVTEKRDHEGRLKFHIIAVLGEDGLDITPLPGRNPVLREVLGLLVVHRSLLSLAVCASAGLANCPVSGAWIIDVPGRNVIPSETWDQKDS